MKDWQLSGEKRYAMAVFENISIAAYISSIFIFTISLIIFHGFDEASIKTAGIFFIIGAFFAVMEAFIVCSMPVSFYLKDQDPFSEDDMENIQNLMDEFEQLDKKENEDNNDNVH